MQPRYVMVILASINFEISKFEFEHLKVLFQFFKYAMFNFGVKNLPRCCSFIYNFFILQYYDPLGVGCLIG